MASALNLFETLPTGRSQRGCEVSDAQFLSLTGSNRQTKREALFAPLAAFRFPFETADILSPLLMVVIAIYPRES